MMKIELVYYGNTKTTRLVVDFAKKTYRYLKNGLYDKEDAETLVRVHSLLEITNAVKDFASNGFTETACGR